jgi:hypothetical protein
MANTLLTPTQVTRKALRVLHGKLLHRLDQSSVR